MAHNIWYQHHLLNVPRHTPGLQAMVPGMFPGLPDMLAMVLGMFPGLPGMLAHIIHHRYIYIYIYIAGGGIPQDLHTLYIYRREEHTVFILCVCCHDCCTIQYYTIMYRYAEIYFISLAFMAV